MTKKLEVFLRELLLTQKLQAQYIDALKQRQDSQAQQAQQFLTGYDDLQHQVGNLADSLLACQSALENISEKIDQYDQRLANVERVLSTLQKIQLARKPQIQAEARKHIDGYRATTTELNFTEQLETRSRRSKADRADIGPLLRRADDWSGMVEVETQG